MSMIYVAARIHDFYDLRDGVTDLSPTRQGNAIAHRP
jgi:hypothetical protein